ncbi:MAG: hypothetical protein JWO58_838 [Chitinophagaceae bacterium]|nr:hypothetical protein [Chitinophagaceae bacterium]
MNVKKLLRLFFIFLGIVLITFVNYSFLNRNVSSCKNKSTSAKHTMSRTGSKAVSSVSSLYLDDESDDEEWETEASLVNIVFAHIDRFSFISSFSFTFLPHPFLHFPSIYILIQSFRL